MVRRSLVLLMLAFLHGVAAAEGDVTVTVTPEGDLVVVGDAENNNITFDNELGFLRLYHAGGTINGSSSSYAVDPIRGRLIVKLGEGNDSFMIMQTFVCDDIEVELGEGADHSDIESGGRALRIDLGEGNDHVNLESASFDRTSVDGGAGNDDISLFYFDADTLSLRAGTGNDSVSVRFCSFRGPCSLDGGPLLDSLYLEDPGFDVRPKVARFENRLE